MNLREVSDEVYLAQAAGAEANRQSLNAFVVERLTEVAQMLDITPAFRAAAFRSMPGLSGGSSTPVAARPGR